MLRRSSLALLLIGCLFWSGAAAAQEAAADAGSVVSMEGTVEIGRAGTWSAATIGSTVRVADQIRTGNPGRARILFTDDSVLNIGDGSLVTIDESVFAPAEGTARFLLRVLTGKVRALVSDYYKGPMASYRVETTTAISAVRGTEFVVAYDEGAELTEVLGLSGTVAVHGTVDRAAHGVEVTELMLTKVAKGAFPTPPTRIRPDDENYRRLMRGVDFAGSGQPESLAATDPLLKRAVPEKAKPTVATRAPAFPQPPAVDAGPGPEGPRTPGDAIQQPVPVLEGSGGINVEF